MSDNTDAVQVDPTEHPVEAAGPAAPITKESAETPPPSESYPKPKGAFLFVVLMMIFYCIYWIISYFEIFVIRGA